jgi:Zn-finger nucleic acid-binding protein
MDCPLCKINLQIADRQGVEIDYCPKCRGIWLDRGELEKIVDMSLIRTQSTAPSMSQGRDRDIQSDRYGHRSDSSSDNSSYSHGKPKKRESWLSDLFDFG